MSHPSILVISSSNTFRFSVYSSRSQSTWVVLSSALAALCAFFLHPTTGIRSSFFFLAGPGALYENAVSAFSRSPLGRAKYFFVPISSANPPYIFLAHSPYLSALAFPYLHPFFISVLYPPSSSIDSISWFPHRSFRAWSTTLSHLVPVLPFCHFPPCSTISRFWEPTHFWHAP